MVFFKQVLRRRRVAGENLCGNKRLRQEEIRKKSLPEKGSIIT
jgi:hypothetical protein